MMGTIAGANASHGCIDDAFCFRVRDRLAGCICFREILPQFIGNLNFLLACDRSRFERASADRFAVMNAAAAEQLFERCLLTGREIGGVANRA
jgi:hypothetical protein